MCGSLIARRTDGTDWSRRRVLWMIADDSGCREVFGGGASGAGEQTGADGAGAALLYDAVRCVVVVGSRLFK